MVVHCAGRKSPTRSGTRVRGGTVQPKDEKRSVGVGVGCERQRGREETTRSGITYGVFDKREVAFLRRVRRRGGRLVQHLGRWPRRRVHLLLTRAYANVLARDPSDRMASIDNWRGRLKGCDNSHAGTREERSADLHRGERGHGRREDGGRRVGVAVCTLY